MTEREGRMRECVCVCVRDVHPRTENVILARKDICSKKVINHIYFLLGLFLEPKATI